MREQYERQRSKRSHTGSCTCFAELVGDKLDKVILFGSYARGDYDHESDIDIMVLGDIPREACSDIRREIRKTLGGIEIEHDVVLSLAVTDTGSFYKFQEDLPFYSNVLREGVILSERA